MVNALGIDVSRYQGAIHWPAVRESGIDFAFVRATIGSIYKDPRCIENVTGAITTGILTSVYHVVRWDYPAEAQYQNLCAMLADLPPLTLPIALDVELPTPAGNTANHRLTLQRTRELIQLLAHDNRSCVLYTGAWWWNPAIKGADVTWALQADLWTASYTTRPRIPSAPWPAFTFWQYTSSGRVPGISGNVDRNYFTSDLPALRVYAAACCGSLPPDPPPNVHTITVTGYNVEIQVTGDRG
jgi:GH25 family lysozyme M1 (1,4-beta-N-acetylmuramidase)